MNPFDVALISLLNGLAQRSWSFDHAINVLVKSDLIKGGVLIAFLWAGWFLVGQDEVRRRCVILGTLAGGFLSLLIARFMALTLPFRIRPFHDPELGFVLPHTMRRTRLEDWSSLPSDHAALLFSLAAGLLLVSRRWGAVALAYVFLFVCLPRVYLGLHYPTDILAGAAVGIPTALLVARSSAFHRWIGEHVLAFESRHPAIFYAAFFLLTYQLAVMFRDVRDLGAFLVDVARAGGIAPPGP